jgi:hypothetical protein
MAAVVASVTAKGHIDDAVHDFLDETLGPLIVADAIRYAPERSGFLRASIRYWVSGDTLYVGAFADYAADVELGHRVFHRFKHVLGPEVVPAEPYLRPALYKYRSPALPTGTTPLVPPGIPHPKKPFEFLTFRQWYVDSYGNRAGVRRPFRVPIA